MLPKKIQITEQQLKEARRKNIVKWRKNGNYWVEDMFGGKIKLSNQQADAFEKLSLISISKIKASEHMKLSALENTYSKYIGMDIASGMGTGKDYFAALCMFYWHTVWPVEEGQPPHGLATANTGKQLKNVLWRQACIFPGMSVRQDPNDSNSKRILDEMFVCQTEKIYRTEYGGRSFFWEAVTIDKNASSDVQAAALTGRHAPYMLMILDEAAGLPEAVFTNLEGTLSGRVNLLLMIYNPIRSNCYAVRAKNTGKFLSLRWNAEDTFFNDPKLDVPLQAKNKDLLDRYDRNSNAYRIKVLGLPPLADSEVFIPWDWVQDAIEREIEPDKDDPIIMGVDPGAGGDNSAIVVRKGPVVLHVTRKNTADRDVFLDWVVSKASEWKPDAINVDVIGISWGIVKDLKKKIKVGKVYSVDVRNTAKNTDEYSKVRDELWGTLKEQFRIGCISIPNDQELINQLGSIKVKEYDHRTGQAKMPPKKELKKSDSVGGSPDEGDALCLTYGISENIIIRNNSINYKEEQEERRQRRKQKRSSVSEVSGY